MMRNSGYGLCGSLALALALLALGSLGHGASMASNS